ncbi:MAG: DNA-binding protein [Alphaproteobacteria bacterium]|nr:DNA-binding protein [Alphaproteobacteria bacterium]
MKKEKDLAQSSIQRQNVLNNPFAIKAMQQKFNLGGIIYKDDLFYTKQMVADIFKIDERTIDRYVSTHEIEFSKNGYRILSGINLKEFKELILLGDIHVVEFDQRTPKIALFSFKTVLNFAMLLSESEVAKKMRQTMLDVVMQVLITRSGGNVKYINQRDEDYLPSAFEEENYRKKFTKAVDQYIDEDSTWKYGKYTNLIYKSIFLEKADEYRKILRLAKSENIRETLYSEALDLIAGFESGLAHELEKKFKETGQKISSEEAEVLFKDFAENPAFKPLIDKVRIKMSSRDLSFRDVLHERLKHYIQSVPEADFEKFLGERSKALEERLEETKDVFKRLKDK